MIIIRDKERLYLDNWSYNGSRIITALKTIIENNGGIVKPGKTALVSNRTLDGAIRESKERIAAIEKNTRLDDEKKNALLLAESRKLEKYETIDNEPIEVIGTYISFVLDNQYYYYSIDDNPFFDFHYIKTPVNDGQYSLDAACENDAKTWLYDVFLTFNASDADIKEAANLIFNMLVSAKPCQIIRDATKRRVPNTYNSGYHYETIYAKERFAKIWEV